ncbi:MAG TPA: YopX family protein [Terriglobales bacterium]|nr:YopX family protein [Terriglobales bacterium]
MKEIKFRAWDESGAMVPVGELHFTQGGLVIEGCGVHLRNPILMQFTGLKDKNGKEIYEGDIVICTRGCPHEMEWLNEVPNENLGGMPGFYLSGLRAGYSWMNEEEVIGNIYENPEIINKPK